MSVNASQRKPLKGKDRSHALNSTNRARKLNLQKHTLQDGTTVRLSVKEIRTLRKGTKNAA